MPAISRNLAVVISVVLLHVGFIYGLQSGLLLRAVELVVPVVVLSQLIEPPRPKDAALPPPPPPRTVPQQVKKPTTQAVTQAVTQAPSKAPTAVAPLPVAINDPTPAPNAPTGIATPQPALAPNAAPVAAPVTAAPATPASPPAVQLPSSNADYLQNPKSAYPPISRRLNEQGRTTVRVFIGADGQPQRAEIAKSSGFTRLDEAAVAAVLRWRYVPGKRGGVAEAMWFNVPIDWVLD